MALVATMVNLGFWQLRRNDEKNSLNTQIEERADQSALGLEDLLEMFRLAPPETSDLSTSPDPPELSDSPSRPSGLSRPASPGLDTAEYRRFQGSGKYICAQTILVRNRTLNGRPGYWVMTPVLIAPVWIAGAQTTSPTATTSPAATSPATTSPVITSPVTTSTVLVNRGWVPRELTVSAVAEAGSIEELAPCLAEEAEISGYIRLPNDKGGEMECNSLAPICTFANPDTPAIAEYLQQYHLQQYPGQQESASPASLGALPSPFGDFYVQLDGALQQAQRSPTELPIILPDPEFDQGPHLSYAVQWFIFSAIAAVGYPLILSRLKKRRRQTS